MNTLLSITPMEVAAAALPWAGLAFLFSFIALFPAWGLRYLLGRGADGLDRWSTRTTGKLLGSDALASGRKLRTFRWTLTIVTTGFSFLILTLAGLLSVLVAANVIGLRRPEFGDAWLPWILGAALMVVVAVAWPFRDEPGRWLRVITVSCAILSVVFIAIIKVEASTIPPAEYARYHPLKDWLLGPVWVLLEVAYFLGGAVLGRAGLEHGIRCLAWLLGLAIELLIQGCAFLVSAISAVCRLLMNALRGLIGVVFLLAALIWCGLREAAGTDIDGEHRLPGLPGGDAL